MHDVLGLISFFAGISLLAVGGGNSTLPAIQHHAVQSGWVDREQFLHIYALGQVAPGPSTMYVAGIGFAVSGWIGAVAAGLAFVLPSSLVIVLAGHAWERWPDTPLKVAVRTGLAPVTVGLITAGAIRLVLALETLSDGTRFPGGTALVVIACITVLVAVLAQTTKVPPAALVLGSGLVSFVILT